MNRDPVKSILSLEIPHIIAVLTSASIIYSIVFKKSFLIWNKVPLGIVQIGWQDIISISISYLPLLFASAIIVLAINEISRKLIFEPIYRIQKHNFERLYDNELGSVQSFIGRGIKFPEFMILIARQIDVLFTLTGVVIISAVLGAISENASGFNDTVEFSEKNKINNVHILRKYDKGILLIDKNLVYHFIRSDGISQVTSPPRGIYGLSFAGRTAEKPASQHHTLKPPVQPAPQPPREPSAAP